MAKLKKDSAAVATIHVAVAEIEAAQAIPVAVAEVTALPAEEAIDEAVEAVVIAKPQDHRPPKVGAREVMAGFRRSMEVTRARRLEALARKFPDVANLIRIAAK